MMIQYHSRADGDSDQPMVSATPETATIHYVGASVYHLRSGQSFDAQVDNHHEHALVLLSGQARISGEDLREQTLLGRSSVFDDTPPYVVYVRPEGRISLAAQSDCEVLWASALLDEPGTLASRVYAPDEMSREVRGSGVTGRQVRHLLEDPGTALRLRLVEVITPGGHWSSFPPHKHDQQMPPAESLLEELYYYHVAPNNLWAFQRVYDASGWGGALAVNDGDLIVVPRGYHPVSAPPGSTVYYVNVMAGPTREWNFTTDPAFSHVPGFSVPHPKEMT